MTGDEIRTRVATAGYVILPDILEPSFVARAKRELAQATGVLNADGGPV